MKIVDIKLYRLPPRWLFLSLLTDSGIIGWGEPVLEGRGESTASAVIELSPYLIGKDPLRINDIWQVLYRSGFYRGGPVLMSALSGIDQALWDIKGKYHNCSVVDLLGGKCRDKIKTYTWVGGDDPEGELEQIEKQVAVGRTAFKFNGSGKMRMIDSFRAVEFVVERIGAIHDRFSGKIDFAIDFHGRVSVPMAKILLKELEFTHPMFAEEPVVPEHSNVYKDLAGQTTIPLACGERLFSRYDCRPILEQGGVSVLQPDPSHAGGLSECLKIGHMAEAYGVALAPHCPLGPMAFATSIALNAICYNAVLQENPINIHYNESGGLLDYVVNKDDFVDTDGFVSPLPGPGLGVDIDINAVEAASIPVQDWKPPVWRHEDGSLAEW